jgi:hypothetical protein
VYLLNNGMLCNVQSSLNFHHGFKVCIFRNFIIFYNVILQLYFYAFFIGHFSIFQDSEEQSK